MGTGVEMTRTLMVLSLLAGLALAGCSSTGEVTGTAVVGGSLVAALNPQQAAPFPEPTRAQLDADGRPVLRAALRDGTVNALLFRVAANGTVETWATADARTLGLRDGILVQTRGLGGDLMSSRVPPVAAIRGGQGTVSRMHAYLGPNDQTVQIDLTCTLSDRGTERVTISGLGYATRRIAETCAGAGASFENLYWVQPDGTIRQSVQWVGPDVGNVALSDLRR